jgi:uncharacterized sulfatase
MSALLALLVAAPAAPPNVLLVISDDHGWADYGFLGHPHVRTPHLDRLAAGSRVFARGYVPSSLCCPSLATIITGLYPHQHKITGNDPPRPAGVRPKDFQSSAAFRDGREVMNRHLDAVPTLPKLLAGHLSLQTGKWWLGDFRRGGFTHGLTAGSRHGDAGLDIGRKTLQPVFDFAAEAGRPGKPWLVWYAPMLPHTPHDPPAELVNRYRPAAGSEPVAKYWANVERFDRTVGELLGHLDRKKLADNTLVIYLADNGWIQNPAGPLSVRSKRTPYDAGLRTPILVRWPGRVPPGRVDTPVSSIDVLPTVLAACGVPVPAGLPGVNLLDPAAVAGRQAVYGACFTHDFVDLHDPAKNVRHRWVVSGGRKLIVPHVPADADGPGAVELYDVAADPTETRELSGDRPADVVALRAKLDAWWTPR